MLVLSIARVQLVHNCKPVSLLDRLKCGLSLLKGIPNQQKKTVYKGAFLWGSSGSGSVIQDLSGIWCIRGTN